MRRARLVTRYLASRAQMRARYERSPLDDLLRSLDGARPRTSTPPLDELATAITLAERLASHAGIRPDTCLFRALSRYALLRREGCAPRFVMGIEPDDPDRGHAWIELDDAPFLERSLAPFQRTFEHPARA